MRLHTLARGSLLSSLSALAFGRILTSPEQIQAKYDFVIVGAGVGGSVLASRLTEDASVSVLVIEAGGMDEGPLGIEVPFLRPSLAHTSLDWNYTTIPQSTLGGRQLPFSRGKAIGGTTVINYHTWNIGSNDTWDRWADITGDQEWVWKNAQRYFHRTSHYAPLPDGSSYVRPVEDFVNPEVYGDGLIGVSAPGQFLPLDDVVVAASNELGGRWGWNRDANGGNGIGVMMMQNSVDGGTRNDAVTSYLRPVASRKNLDILIYTHVTKVLPSPNAAQSANEVHFSVVQMAQGPATPRRIVEATKEIILAGGVFNTPQLLQLSGIGPKTLLESHDIPVHIDGPEVGAHFSEHPMVPLYFRVNSTETADSVFRNPAVFDSKLEQWMTSKTGLFSNSPGNIQAYYRLDGNDPLLVENPKVASGPHSPHFEAIFVSGFAPFGPIPPPSEGNWLTILVGLMATTSRGHVNVSSSDPFASPIIDPQILSTSFDKQALREGIRTILDFVRADSFKGYILEPHDALRGVWWDLESNDANEELEARQAAYIGKTAWPFNHPAGSCAMRANGGVLDAHFRVKGARGLRVVDSSVFPEQIHCHPQAVVYTLAERAADLVKEEYTLESFGIPQVQKILHTEL